MEHDTLSLLDGFVNLILKLGLALLAAGAVAGWAIPAAYAQRGYNAVGGEWLLILAGAALGWSAA